MQTFHKFFWTVTVVGLVIIGIVVGHKLFFERTAHGDVVVAQQIPKPTAAIPHQRPPVDDEMSPNEVPDAPAREHDVELPNAIVEQLIDKKVKPPQHTTVELYLSFAVLAFGFLVMFGQFIIMIRERRYFDNMSLKMLTITMAITSALFLITAGFSSDQIQPAIGLISGTLGFAFGLRGDTPQTEPLPPTPKP